MTNVTCGLTAKKPGSPPCPTLVIEYGTTLDVAIGLYGRAMHEISVIKQPRYACPLTLVDVCRRLLQQWVTIFH